MLEVVLEDKKVSSVDIMERHGVAEFNKGTYFLLDVKVGLSKRELKLKAKGRDRNPCNCYKLDCVYMYNCIYSDDAVQMFSSMTHYSACC